MSVPAFETAKNREEPSEGIGPYRLALRRLRRNKVAIFFLAVFAVIVILCLLAPLYASKIANTGPNHIPLSLTANIAGKTVQLRPQGIPIGPTWHQHYLLGADDEGRDLAVRLLYGGRTSLEIGALATSLTIVLGLAFGVLAGYLRGIFDAILRPIMELIWSFPVVLLGVALGTALALGGIGPIKGNSLLIPAFIIGVVYVPYFGKPIRAQVLNLREQDYIDAARVQGAGSLRIMFSEILPNLASTIIVFIPLILAQAILLEAYLSFLGAGVQKPAPSWGAMISAGIQYIENGAAVHITLIPGIMLVLAVLGINVFGDGVRDALDPRAQVRIEH